MQPTEEQAAIVRAALNGTDLAVEALAGTGKTTTLTLVAQALDRPGLYVAFNKAIVKDAGGRFPTGVDCRTAHSLAYRAVGSRYSQRLKAPKLRPEAIAEALDCVDQRLKLNIPGKRVLDGVAIASLAWRAAMRFAKTADVSLTQAHVPLPPDVPETLRADLAEHILPLSAKVWADLTDTKGQLQFSHDIYLKLWQLEQPRLTGEFVMFDEAQDADPVMLDVIRQQTHMQRIYVGDRFQAIYEWRGAVNAMELIDVPERLWLTQSFRFGPAVADVANQVLRRLGADQLVSGTSGVPSSVGSCPNPNVVLTRTNAHAITHVIEELDRGGQPALVGGADDVRSFAYAARDLQQSRRTSHPLLTTFRNWEEVQGFIANASEEEVGEMGMLVRLVDAFGPSKLTALLRQCVAEEMATLVVSTAHKAKGREWDRVKIGADFPDVFATQEKEPPVEELRLAYVALTRAKLELDTTDMGGNARDRFERLVGNRRTPARGPAAARTPVRVGYQKPSAQRASGVKSGVQPARASWWRRLTGG